MSLALRTIVRWPEPPALDDLDLSVSAQRHQRLRDAADRMVRDVERALYAGLPTAAYASAEPMPSAASILATVDAMASVRPFMGRRLVRTHHVPTGKAYRVNPPFGEPFFVIGTGPREEPPKRDPAIARGRRRKRRARYRRGREKVRPRYRSQR